MTDYQFMDMIQSMEYFIETCRKSKCENCEQREQCVVAERHGFAMPRYWK